jgi:hypothetical protein
MQRNDGRWDFSIEESEDGSAIVLEVDVGKFLDTSLIKADVQPSYIRWGFGFSTWHHPCFPCLYLQSAPGCRRTSDSGTLQELWVRTEAVNEGDGDWLCT